MRRVKEKELLGLSQVNIHSSTDRRNGLYQTGLYEWALHNDTAPRENVITGFLFTRKLTLATFTIAI